jgi:hypothetical protein
MTIVNHVDVTRKNSDTHTHIIKVLAMCIDSIAMFRFLLNFICIELNFLKNNLHNFFVSTC